MLPMTAALHTPTPHSTPPPRPPPSPPPAPTTGACTCATASPCTPSCPTPPPSSAARSSCPTCARRLPRPSRPWPTSSASWPPCPPATPPPEEIGRARAAGVVACKLSPAGATTNSDAGVTDLRKTYKTLEAMQKAGMLLLVHGEVTSSDIDLFDREAVFIEQQLIPLLV